MEAKKENRAATASPAAAVPPVPAVLVSLAAAAVLAAAAILAVLAAAPPLRAYAHDKASQPVRVGICADGAAVANPAADSVRLYCELGLMAEWAGSQGGVEQLVKILFVSKSSTLEVKKYAHGGRFAILASPQPADGAASYAEAAWLLADLGSRGHKGVLAYFPLDGGGAGGAGAGSGAGAGRPSGWHVLVGAFGSAAAAEASIEADLGGGQPGAGYAGVRFVAAELAGKYVSASLDGQVQFICDASSGGGVRFTPQGGARVSMDGKQYRGAIELLRLPGSDMSVVDVMPMDEYLYGVVPSEIEALSPAEALKAQAVAARTYAVNSLGRHAAQGFQLCTSVHCQVYGGLGGEHEQSSRAVDATAGKIVLYGGEPAQAFFFSSSGGRTEDVSNVWGSAFPYLVSVDDPYESGKSTYYSWETAYTAKEIEAQLRAAGDDVGAVLDVAVVRRSEAGRAVEVTVTGSNGAKTFTNESCRTFLDGLRSQSYTISGAAGYAAVGAGGAQATVAVAGQMAVSGDGVSGLAGAASQMSAASASGTSKLPARQSATFLFSGKGWGHAVGMSQEGAKGMASAGFGYVDILCHYFPGCVVG